MKLLKRILRLFKKDLNLDFSMFDCKKITKKKDKNIYDKDAGCWIYRR